MLQMDFDYVSHSFSCFSAEFATEGRCWLVKCVWPIVCQYGKGEQAEEKEEEVEVEADAGVEQKCFIYFEHWSTNS